MILPMPQYRVFLTVFALFAAALLPAGAARAQLLTGYIQGSSGGLAAGAPGTARAEVRPAAYQGPVLAEPVPAGAPADGSSSSSSVSSVSSVFGPGLPAAQGRDLPVDLAADSLTHDDAAGVIIAAGHVELRQGDRVLRADEIRYDMNSAAVTARGHVALYEPTGDIHFADEAVLSDNMRKGLVRGLQSYLVQGGTFSAAEAERVNEKLITMRDASYTPCECEENQEGDPAWRIRADEVTVDEESHKIRYKNARFEIFGIPIAYTPFLTHPDGKVKRKSGFLSPSVGYDSKLGLTMTQNYYYSMAPDRDATIGVMAMTRETPVALAEYRQRFEQADLHVSGSATRSERSDSVAGQEVIHGEEFRGHLFADSLWNINDTYRAGLDLELTTDDQYLRQYDFSGKDVLENELYVERFAGRNYAVGRLLAFQDVRVQEEQTDQPNIMPEIEADFVGEPNATLGGRWDGQASALQLQRNKGQDMTRLTGRVGWQRRDVTGFGLVSRVDLGVRGDAYHVTDRDVAQNGSGRSSEGTDTRVMPRAHVVTRYPLVRPVTGGQVMVEPIAALTAATNIDNTDAGIPNEDSQDVQLDASNLFEANRFPGKDRLEDRVHATYGVRSGVYGGDGSFGDVFLGQSYRLHGDDNPFPDGSGLERQSSDWVGQIAGVYKERFGVNYRFQLDGANLASRRHEVDGFAGFGRLDLQSRYLFADSLGGTDIEESREQLYGEAAYRLTQSWRVRGSMLQDLGENPGLREATFGLDYFGCCLSFSATVERNVTSDVSGDSGTDVMFRLGLKGLGEFQTAPGGAAGGVN